MNSIHRALLLFFLTPPFFSSAQTDTLYSLGQENHWQTQAEITHLIEKKEAALENDSLAWVVQFKPRYEKKQGDTLLVFGGLNIKAESILSETEKIDSRLNKPFPDFELTALDGQLIRKDDLVGKVVLFNFWFTRCAPCIAEMPHLNQIKADYAAENIVFLSMAPEEEELIWAFLNKTTFDFTHFPDADIVLKKFGTGFPKNILVDKRGVVRYIGGGLVGESATHTQEDLLSSERELRAMIDYWLGQ